jgi:hypothetical protein
MTFYFFFLSFIQIFLIKDNYLYTIVSAAIIYVTIFIYMEYVLDQHKKIMNFQKKCRNDIYLIINSIIWGTLKDPNMIREIYQTIVEENHIYAQKLIKELKMDKD